MKYSQRLDLFGDEIFAALNERRLELEKQGKKIYNMSVSSPSSCCFLPFCFNSSLFGTKKYLVNSVSDGAKAIDFSITEEKQLLAI